MDTVKEKVKCEHRDRVYLYTIDDYDSEPLAEVYRCLECQQLINIYLPPPNPYFK